MNNKKTCAVIGGGLAGLSAAACLAAHNIAVTLFEASPKTGGRVYAFSCPGFQEPLDNGQHILMGCYTDTLHFLNVISPTDRLIKQRTMAIDFILPDGTHSALKAVHGPHPINLLMGMLRYDAIDWGTKYRLIQFMTKLFLARKPLSRESETIAEWLLRLGQDAKARACLWDIISIGTMNAEPELASARLFESILKQMFFRDAFSATLIVPGADLSQTFCLPAESYIAAHGGDIRCGERVTAIESTPEHPVNLRIGEHSWQTFDAAVFAAPLHAIQKIAGIENFVTLPECKFQYSAIITFHFRLHNNPLQKQFYGIIGSPLQWVFNHGEHITTVTSAANELVEKTEEELFALFSGELHKYFAISPGDIFARKMIKEKRATFIPSPQCCHSREQIRESSPLVAIAGDWTNTGLPATIEGAIRSGRIAAEKIVASGKRES
jgi:squalene-associated FAD-dependent desaturase